MLVSARSLGPLLGRNAMVFLYAEQKIFACEALIFVQTQLNVTDCHRCTGGYPAKFHSNSQWCCFEVNIIIAVLLLYIYVYENMYILYTDIRSGRWPTAFKAMTR